MSLLNVYRKQSVIWRSVKRDVNTGEPIRNIDGEVEYEDHPIDVRWEDRIAIVLDSRGEEKTSHARIFSEDPITADDTLILNGRPWPVITVGTPVSLSGTILHREVSV